MLGTNWVGPGEGIMLDDLIFKLRRAMPDSEKEIVARYIELMRRLGFDDPRRCKTPLQTTGAPMEWYDVERFMSESFFQGCLVNTYEGSMETIDRRYRYDHA